MTVRYKLDPDSWSARYSAGDLRELIDIILSTRDKLSYKEKEKSTNAEFICMRFLLTPLSHKPSDANLALDSIKEKIAKILKKQESYINDPKKKSANKLSSFDYEIKRYARFMYEVEFEDLPLHIKESAFLPKIIIQWRLGIGK